MGLLPIFFWQTKTGESNEFFQWNQHNPHWHLANSSSPTEVSMAQAVRLTGPLGGKLGFFRWKRWMFFQTHWFSYTKKKSQVEKLLWISNVKDRFFWKWWWEIGRCNGNWFSSALRPSNLDWVVWIHDIPWIHSLGFFLSFQGIFANKHSEKWKMALLYHFHDYGRKSFFYQIHPRGVWDWVLRRCGLGKNAFHGNPQPSFLRVITHISQE